MKRRRCSKCGVRLGRYVIAAPAGLACPRCGPRVDGGKMQADAVAYLLGFARARGVHVRP